jgi:hypothetical protein
MTGTRCAQVSFAPVTMRAVQLQHESLPVGLEMFTGQAGSERQYRAVMLKS